MIDINKRYRVAWLNYWIEDANQSKKRIMLIGDFVIRQARKWINLFMGKEYVVDVLAMSFGITDSANIAEIKHYFDITMYEYEYILYNGCHRGYNVRCSENLEDELEYTNSPKEILEILKNVKS